MAQQSENWNSCLQYAAFSDIGMRRSNNQDAFVASLAGSEAEWRERGHFFVVADGMGAHAAGELASKIAADGVPFHYHKYTDISPPEALQKAVIETNAEIYRRGQANTDFYNMGTTCSSLALLPQGALLAHVGDSRIYRLRGDLFQQLTFDHSLVWEMLAAKKLPFDSELSNSVPKNVITRSLGPHAAVQVDIEGPFPIEQGDTFLLCSDGLSGKIENDEMGSFLTCLPPDEAVRILVDLANLRGGPDNITVIVVKVTGQEVTTAVAGDEPITLGPQKQERVVHPVLWAIMGICFVSAAGMALLQSPAAALAATLGGMICLLTILIQICRKPPKGVEIGQQHRLGRGPYTQCQCKVEKPFVNKLCDIADQIREIAKQNKREIDLTLFEKHYKKAAANNGADQYPSAVRQYTLGITSLLKQVRHLKNS